MTLQPSPTYVLQLICKMSSRLSHLFFQAVLGSHTRLEAFAPLLSDTVGTICPYYFLQMFVELVDNTWSNVCGRNLITELTSAASPRVDVSSTCKVGQKLGVSLPLLTWSASAWPSRLLYRRGRKSRRDLRITLYIFLYIYIYIYVRHYYLWTLHFYHENSFICCQQLFLLQSVHFL